METLGLSFALVVLAGLVAIFIGVYLKSIEFAALAVPAQTAAFKHLKNIRFEKMDKEAVMVLTLQKSGSTLLCYVCALINTRNNINKFRNDFDLLPMLSFDQPMIYQNINARQDGKYQLYKINGRANTFHALLTERYNIKKVIWMCREFSGYYRSVYWWVNAFYPKITPLKLAPIRPLFYLRFLPWDLFKAKTLEKLASDHVEELWFVYNLVQQRPVAEFMALSYEQLIGRKESALKVIADWFGVDADSEMIHSIAHKTSKEEMARGDRFDPLHFGDGGGQTKINLQPHQHKLSDRDMEVYNDIFRRRFEVVGIKSYDEFTELLWKRANGG